MVVKIGFDEFVKLALSSFMVEGVRSLVVFRLRDDGLTYFTSEAGNMIVMEIDEPKKCHNSDYYRFWVNDEVKYECRKGLPSRDMLLQGQIVFVIKPDELVMTGVEEDERIKNEEN